MNRPQVSPHRHRQRPTADNKPAVDSVLESSSGGAGVSLPLLLLPLSANIHYQGQANKHWHQGRIRRKQAMLQPTPSMLFLLPLVGLLLPATFPASSNMAAAFTAFSTTTSTSSRVTMMLRQQRLHSRRSLTTLANSNGSSLDPVTYLRTEWVSAALVANQTPRVADRVLQLGVGDGRIVNFVPRTVRYVN